MPFAGGLHRLGGELRRAGNERDAGRDHEIWCGVEHDAHFAAQRHAPCHGFGQEEGHVHIGQIGQLQHAGTCAHHLAGLHHAELHAAIARGLEFTVGQLHVDAGQRGLQRAHIGLGTGHLGAGGTDARLRGLGLRLGCCQGGLQAAHLGTVVIEQLGGKETVARKLFRAWQAPLGGIQIAVALRYHRQGRLVIALALGHLHLGTAHSQLGLLQAGHGLVALGLQAVDLHAGHGLASCHKVALAHEDVEHPARLLGGDGHLRGFNAAVAADKSLAGPLGLPGRPIHQPCSHCRQQHHCGSKGLELLVHASSLWPSPHAAGPVRKNTHRVKP